nr:vascular endothelial growth factor receptor 1-like [Megalopta genalis]
MAHQNPYKNPNRIQPPATQSCLAPRLITYGGNLTVLQYAFDPKIGFTLDKVNNTQNEWYICTIGPNQEVSYFVIVSRSTDNVLPQPRIANNTLLHVKKGETLYLKCTITIPRDQNYYNASWIPWKQSFKVTTWNASQNIGGGGMVEKMALLRVTNVTYTEEGIYQCRVKDKNYEKNSRTYVQVHDALFIKDQHHPLQLLLIECLESIDPFIKLTTTNPNRYYKRNIGDSMELVVDVDAYPPPDVQWFDTHGDEIPATLWLYGRLKLSVDIAHCKPTLRINSLNLNDMGIYSIQASNQYKKETLNFTLEIIAKPKVHMSEPSRYHFHNQVAKVECHVEAFPKPNVTWSYSKCPNDLPCDDATPKYLTNAKENGTVTQLVSTVWTVIEKFSKLTCSACNIVGCGTVTKRLSASEEVGDFGIILTKEPVAEGDDWELICAASIHNYSDTFDWSRETGPIVQSDRISIHRERTVFTYRSILKIRNVKIEDSQEYICTGKSMGNLTQSTGYRLEVNAARAPIITDTNLKKGEKIIDLNTPDHKGINVHCFVDGMPKPSIIWFKDGTQLLINNDKHKISNNSQKVEMAYPLEVDSGVYMCRAENRFGKVEASQRIRVKGNFRLVTVIILPVMLAVLVLILVIFVGLKYRRYRTKNRKLMRDAFRHFEKGAVECLNPELTLDDQADLLPYDKKWEFPIENLKLGKKLGSGAFGVVLKAEALGICESGEKTTVAVKMDRRGPDNLYMSELGNEIKIMIHVGKHLNVVNLLGVCTKDKLEHRLLAIVEFCQFGNLRDYLFKHRSDFINQIDPTTGKFDLNIGQDRLILTRPARLCSTNRVKSAELSSCFSNRSSESDSVQCHARDSVLDSASSQPGWSNYRGDYKDSNVKPICTQDLLSWAFQVARGMEYLSQRRVLHGDLAARNILLADDNVVKICDFGLAKSMYKEEIYKKKSNGPLPIKWLAIEAMRDRIFSTQSDIWSFGIVLWEFFTLAMTPYPGIESEIVYQKLIEGYRMGQPEYATPEVYDIMHWCWKDKPYLRPSFTELVDRVGNLLEKNVRAHYIELNVPYLDMNKTLLEDGKEDYLMLVSAPDHVALSSPTRDPANPDAFETTRESGYFSMIREDTEETSLMLDKEEEDPYLKPISVQERKAQFATSKGSASNQSVGRSGLCQLQTIDE